MVKAVRVHETGGPEAMRIEDIELPPPGRGEVLVRNHAIGVNFIDVYFRKGLYPAPPPFTPGNEGAGEVIAVGKGVKDFKVGDRVAYLASLGAYAQERVVAEDRLIKLPKRFPYEVAAAMMLKGLTAQYLLRQTFKVKAGDIDPRPCGGGRRRAHPLPMGEGARRPCDRHGRLGRKRRSSPRRPAPNM